MDFRKTALSSPRLQLRAFESEDAAEIFAAVTPTLTRFMAFDPSPSFDAFAEVWRSWTPKMAAGTNLFLVVRLALTGEFLGVVGLHNIVDLEAEAGVWMKESSHGFGYGKEAVSTLINWASATTGTKGILYPVVEENHPSRRLAESLNGEIVGSGWLKKAAALDYPTVIYRIPAPAPADVPPPIPVILAPYNPAWPVMAAEYAAGLRALGSTLVTAHHIGSTSVPGLAAKPIIDLMPLVTSLDALDRKRSLVEALGYSWHGELGITGRRYCALSDADGNRLAQLHFFAGDSAQVARHLAFRDYLRAHPEVAQAYELEKRRARDRHPNDSHAYTDEKRAWIQRIEAEALIWFDEKSS